jgi:ComF family protein
VQKTFGVGCSGLFWCYEGVLRKALLNLKYEFATEIAKELAGHIVGFLKTERLFLPKKAMLTTVPLHWYRGNWRGFNQSEEIGRSLAKRMGWRFEPNLLIRKKAAWPQTGLKGKERKVNVKGVFSLNPAYTLDPKTYTLILFDDIWTTGATLKEAAEVLKRAGVKKVWGPTIAR